MKFNTIFIFALPILALENLERRDAPIEPGPNVTAKLLFSGLTKSLNALTTGLDILNSIPGAENMNSYLNNSPLKDGLQSLTPYLNQALQMTQPALDLIDQHTDVGLTKGFNNLFHKLNKSVNLGIDPTGDNYAEEELAPTYQE